MTYRPDPEFLRELGETSTNASNAWAGAENYLVQGLVHWIRQQVSDDQKVAVKAAVNACKLVIDRYPADGADAHAPRSYVDDMLAKIQRWIENPSNSNKEAVRGSIDTTRQLHAWQGHQESQHFWILEAVDHASLAVWAGERSSYIVPLDFGTCAARSLACVLHALLLSGKPEPEAVAAITGAIAEASGK
ncbi:MAG TPA: hypothetical protein VM513_03900 [Kofleriaceae bacterium]|jgi:hypothetical protein|nr:hypothetical protein [Kofleriaceae bacterium]